MHFFIIVLFICFFIFLYALYFLASDDWIIIKKDMPMEKIFNTAFLTALVALFFSRFLYVVLFPKSVYFSILGFLLFPYFPGLSLAGAVLGGSLFLYFYAKTQKLPIGKTFDFFSIALLTALPIGFLGTFILIGQRFLMTFIFSFLIYLIFFFIFIKVTLPASFRGNIKSGSVALIFLICFSVVSFLARIIYDYKNFNLFSGENIILIFVFIISLAFFLKQEIIGKTRGKK